MPGGIQETFGQYSQKYDLILDGPVCCIKLHSPPAHVGRVSEQLCGT